MPSTRIALAPGDGIGPEIMDATLELFRVAEVLRHLEFVPVEMGEQVFATGNTRGMTDEAVRTVEEAGILFKGPMATPKGGGGKSINVTARKIWNAFANLRTFRTLPGVDTFFSKSGVAIDLVVVRENIEDTYGGVEHRLSNDVMQGKRFISAPGCDQVVRFAFETARRMGLKSIHCGHKANIMKMTDGLFLERFRAAAKNYAGIAASDVIVDALCMNLVMRPNDYRMVVLTNLQGDIVSDLAAGLVGGLGFAPSANIGTHISIFEAVHGTAPDIAGKGIANPAALILSGLMMLRHVGLTKHAALIENALLRALEDGVRTGDFGDKTKPALPTKEFVALVAQRLGQAPQRFRAAPAASGDTVAWKHAPRPTQASLIRTDAHPQRSVAGLDLYLDTIESVPDVAAELTRICEDTPFALTLLSNRGTLVWPTASIYTERVDYLRARFELRRNARLEATNELDSQDEPLKLLRRVSERYLVGEYQLLRTFDGVKGYSLAQGQ